MAAVLFLFIVMLAVAVVYSMVGLGGGTTYLPILLASGIQYLAASTVSLFMIMVASLATALVFGRKREVDWALFSAIVLPSIFGAFAGGFIAESVSSLTLKLLLAMTLLFAFAVMLRPVKEGTILGSMPQWFPWERSRGDYRYRISMGVLLPTVLLTGFISGMVGIAGGIFVLPLLVMLFGCPTRIAIGVMSPYVGIAALPGFLGHIIGGASFDIWLAIPLAVAVFAGASLGSRLSLRTSTFKLRTVLSAILLVLALYVLASVVVG